MRITRAFSTMFGRAGRNPIWAISALLVTVLSRSGIVFIVLYIGIVLVTGIVAGPMLVEAGFETGTWGWAVSNVAFLLAMVLLFFAMLAPFIVVHFGEIDADTHGSARFATASEVAPLTRADDGLLIGRDGKTGKLLGYDGPAHLLTMAPTRTGKGVGTIIPNLLTADRLVICIDPKGENAKITGRARETFGPVHIVDPFGVTGLTSAAFNPLDALDPDGLDVAEDAGILADALVYDDPGMAGEAHWNEEAKALISGLLLKIVAEETRYRRTLTTLREYLTLPPDAFAALLKRMQDNGGAGGLIARAANRHLGPIEKRPV